MTCATAFPLPSDPAERRRLWREWTRTDPPAVQRSSSVHTKAVRRAIPAADLWAQETIDAPAGVAAGLRKAVEAAIIDGHLSITDRERLLRRAERLGVTRFEATLLIAAVQHRAGLARDERVVRAVWKQPARGRSLAMMVGACVAIEAMALSALVVWLQGH